MPPPPFEDPRRHEAQGQQGVYICPITSVPIVGEEASKAAMPTTVAVAGDLLDELGYLCAFPQPSLQALEQAREVRTALAREVRSRTEYPLPKRW